MIFIIIDEIYCLHKKSSSDKGFDVNKRRATKPVYVGDVKVGGGSDITVQSMTKTDTRDVKATVQQIK